jgi:hypothetical protein
VVKIGKYNVRLDHLSRLKTREASRSLDDELIDVQLFHVESIPYQLAEITKFLMSRPVTHSVDYQLITGHLYNLGTDGILHRCALEHE